MLDQVCSIDNLKLAFRRVKKNSGGPGMDDQTVQQFESRLEDNLRRLALSLRNGNYRPQPGKRVWIPKPGKDEKRPLSIPTVKDRIVQTALLIVLEPLFEPGFAERSYGFRPGKGCLDALREVTALRDAGYIHVLDADICKFFDSINHPTLLDLLSLKVKEERILRLIGATLQAGILEGGTITEPGLGTPQGGPVSPLLANITLDPLDRLMARQGFQMVRYADDFLVLCSTRQQTFEGLELVKEWLNTTGLSLHPNKIRITKADSVEGFDFLGYRFWNNLQAPRPENVQQLKENLWHRTRRSDRRNPEEVVADVNQVLKGWFQHFRLTNNPVPFKKIDAWVKKRIANLQSLRRRRYNSNGTNRITRVLFSLSDASIASQLAP
jgi:RNA-directed DNA polymerase